MTSALIDLPLLSWYYDGSSVAQTKNLGSLGGTAQVGDGTTVATFPTFLGGGKRGIILPGSKYLESSNVIASTTATIFLAANRTAAVTGYLADARASAGTGWILDTAGTLTASAGTLYVDGRASAVLPLGIHSVCCSGLTLASVAKIVWGADNARANSWQGRLYSAKVFPYALTPTQIRSMHERSMMEIA